MTICCAWEGGFPLPLTVMTIVSPGTFPAGTVICTLPLLGVLIFNVWPARAPAGMVILSLTSPMLLCADEDATAEA